VRVLVVEDDYRMGDYVSRALTEEAMAVDLARDGTRGLEMALAYDYDAIVLDVMLPGIDGFAICRRLRDRASAARIIIVSGRDLVEDRVRGLDAGADDYLCKPFRRGEEVIALTQKEYAFLEYMMRNPGLVLTRTMIAEHVWDFSFDLASNVVDVYVKQLRKKIDRPGMASYIQAVRGAGYMFQDPAAARRLTVVQPARPVSA
jgi:DNA-binding response OmpR family regulator